MYVFFFFFFGECVWCSCSSDAPQALPVFRHVYPSRFLIMHSCMLNKERKSVYENYMHILVQRQIYLYARCCYGGRAGSKSAASVITRR